VLSSHERLAISPRQLGGNKYTVIRINDGLVSALLARFVSCKEMPATSGLKGHEGILSFVVEETMSVLTLCLCVDDVIIVFVLRFMELHMAQVSRVFS
jgi:hypothetical protein